jgi:hypothetical protein
MIILTSSKPREKYVHVPNTDLRRRYREWAIQETARRNRVETVSPEKAEANRANTTAMIAEIRRQDPEAFAS